MLGYFLALRIEFILKEAQKIENCNRLDKQSKKRALHESLHVHCKKWPPFLLDFCEKYTPPASKSEQVRQFIEKLKSNCLEKSNSPAWDQAIELLAAKIKVRHYSRKTLKTYADWGRKFQRYLTDKPPEEVTAYIPAVLSRRKIEAIISYLEYPFDIVASLLYGCGLCLFECLSLRSQNFNFAEGILSVHGKGDKDRTVPLPQRLIARLTT